MIHSLLALPEDIHILIYLLLPVQDVLSLAQTCRTLYTVGSTDFLWHCISRSTSIPLGVATDSDLQALSNYELRNLFVRALKLDHNWRKPSPTIKKFIPIIYGSGSDKAAVNAMHLLPGAEWLVTAQRTHRVGRPRTAITLWCLQDFEHPYRASSVDVDGHFEHFSVALREQGRVASVIITTDINLRNTIQLYDLYLRNRSELEYAQRIDGKCQAVIPRPSQARGVIDQITIHENTIAVAFVNLSPEDMDYPYQIWLLDILTMNQTLFTPESPEALSSRLVIRLLNDDMILLDFAKGSITVRSFTLTSPMDRPSYQYDSVGREHGTFFISEKPEISFIPWKHDAGDMVVSETLDVTHGSQKIYAPYIYFPDSTQMDGEVGRLLLTASEHDSQSLSRGFSVPRMTNAPIVQVGSTGRRAVWIEHNWDTDQSRLLKSYVPAENVEASNVGVLLPSDPGLPFTPALCHSIVFDEVAGRLCLGLFTGDLWLLDFV